MVPHLGKQIIAMHILPNISGNKGNQTMNLKNHTQNVVEKLFPDPFLKSQN